MFSGLVVFVGVVLLVVWLLRQVTGQDRSTRPDGRALATLRRRYAAGELTSEQYRQMADELGAPGSWPPD